MVKRGGARENLFTFSRTFFTAEKALCGAIFSALQNVQKAYVRYSPVEVTRCSVLSGESTAAPITTDQTLALFSIRDLTVVVSKRRMKEDEGSGTAITLTATPVDPASVKAALESRCGIFSWRTYADGNHRRLFKHMEKKIWCNDTTRHSSCCSSWNSGDTNIRCSDTTRRSSCYASWNNGDTSIRCSDTTRRSACCSSWNNGTIGSIFFIPTRKALPYGETVPHGRRLPAWTVTCLPMAHVKHSHTCNSSSRRAPSITNNFCNSLPFAPKRAPAPFLLCVTKWTRKGGLFGISRVSRHSTCPCQYATRDLSLWRRMHLQGRQLTSTERSSVLLRQINTFAEGNSGEATTATDSPSGRRRGGGAEEEELGCDNIDDTSYCCVQRRTSCCRDAKILRRYMKDSEVYNTTSATSSDRSDAYVWGTCGGGSTCLWPYTESSRKNSNPPSLMFRSRKMCIGSSCSSNIGGGYHHRHHIFCSFSRGLSTNNNAFPHDSSSDDSVSASVETLDARNAFPHDSSSDDSVSASVETLDAHNAFPHDSSSDHSVTRNIETLDASPVSVFSSTSVNLNEYVARYSRKQGGAGSTLRFIYNSIGDRWCVVYKPPGWSVGTHPRRPSVASVLQPLLDTAIAARSCSLVAGGAGLMNNNNNSSSRLRLREAGLYHLRPPKNSNNRGPLIPQSMLREMELETSEQDKMRGLFFPFQLDADAQGLILVATDAQMNALLCRLLDEDLRIRREFRVFSDVSRLLAFKETLFQGNFSGSEYKRGVLMSFKQCRTGKHFRCETATSTTAADSGKVATPPVHHWSPPVVARPYQYTKQNKKTKKMEYALSALPYFLSSTQWGWSPDQRLQSALADAERQRRGGGRGVYGVGATLLLPKSGDERKALPECLSFTTTSFIDTTVFSQAPPDGERHDKNRICSMSVKKENDPSSASPHHFSPTSEEKHSSSSYYYHHHHDDDNDGCCCCFKPHNATRETPKCGNFDGNPNSKDHRRTVCCTLMPMISLQDGGMNRVKKRISETNGSTEGCMHGTGRVVVSDEVLQKQHVDGKAGEKGPQPHHTDADDEERRVFYENALEKGGDGEFHKDASETFDKDEVSGTYTTSVQKVSDFAEDKDVPVATIHRDRIIAHNCQQRHPSPQSQLRENGGKNDNCCSDFFVPVHKCLRLYDFQHDELLKEGKLVSRVAQRHAALRLDVFDDVVFTPSRENGEDQKCFVTAEKREKKSLGRPHSASKHSNVVNTVRRERGNSFLKEMPLKPLTRRASLQMMDGSFLTAELAEYMCRNILGHSVCSGYPPVITPSLDLNAYTSPKAGRWTHVEELPTACRQSETSLGAANRCGHALEKTCRQSSRIWACTNFVLLSLHRRRLLHGGTGILGLYRVSLGAGPQKTHQIRVHFSEAGAPLANDVLYNPACCRASVSQRLVTPIPADPMEDSGPLLHGHMKSLSSVTTPLTRSKAHITGQERESPNGPTCVSETNAEPSHNAAGAALCLNIRQKLPQLSSKDACTDRQEERGRRLSSEPERPCSGERSTSSADPAVAAPESVYASNLSVRPEMILKENAGVPSFSIQSPEVFREAGENNSYNKGHNRGRTHSKCWAASNGDTGANACHAQPCEPGTQLGTTTVITVISRANGSRKLLEEKFGAGVSMCQKRVVVSSKGTLSTPCIHTKNTSAFVVDIEGARSREVLVQDAKREEDASTNKAACVSEKHLRAEKRDGIGETYVEMPETEQNHSKVWIGGGGVCDTLGLQLFRLVMPDPLRLDVPEDVVIEVGPPPEWGSMSD